LKTELDSIAWFRDEKNLTNNLGSAWGSPDMTYMTKRIRQTFWTSLDTDVLDSNIAMEQHKVYTSLSGLSA
jgi:hypothetical protein